MFTRDSVIISRNIKTPLTSISRAVGNILQLTFNAPYNLTVEFKMTNRLELNWELDGVVDGQRYYCSETLFTPETKPAPKVILVGDVRTYTDQAIEINKTYYVAVGSFKGSAEKLSNITEITTPLDENTFYASSLLNFENGFTDKKELIWTPIGNAAVTNAQAKFGDFSLSATIGGLSTPDSEALRPITGDYTVAFWYRPNVLTDWHTMFNKGYWNAAGGLAIILGWGSIKVCSDTSDSGDIGHGITANTWSFIELSRVNGEAYLFTNGILRMKFAQPQDLNSTLPLALMSGGGIVGGASGFMDEFRFVVGRGWHTENYELPITPF